MTVSAIGRIVKATGKLMFMDHEFTRIAEESLKQSAGVTNWRNIHHQNWKNIHRQIGDCFIKAERQTCNDSFWGNLWKKQILGFPKDIASAWRGSSGILGTTKALGGQLLHRLPIIFAAFELPNIISAFKDEGLVGGLTETVKSSVKLAGSMAGFSIGQALIPIPIVGGLIGAFATDWLLGKVLGKSHTEKKEELAQATQNADNQYQQALQQLQQMQQMPQQGVNPAAINQVNNFYPTIMPRATMSPQQVMQLGQMLYGGGMTNPMNQDYMAMMSGMNRLNYMC